MPDGDTDCAESCDESSDACTAPDPDSDVCEAGQFVGRMFLFTARAVLLDDLVSYSEPDLFQMEAVFSGPAATVGGGAIASYIPDSVGITVNNQDVVSVADPQLTVAGSILSVELFPEGDSAAVLLDVFLAVTPSPSTTFLDLLPLDRDSPEVQGEFMRAFEDSLPFGEMLVIEWSLSLLPSSGAVPDGDLVAGVPLTLARSAVSGDLDLSWGASCTVTDDDYAVYEGVLGDFTSHVPVGNPGCSTGGATSTTLTPGAGDRYYLVVPTGTGGRSEGSYGFASDGTPRPKSLSACATQSVGECF